MGQKRVPQESGGGGQGGKKVMKNLQGASHVYICLHAAMLESKFLFSLVPSLCVLPGKKQSGERS